jgi:predicted  nucleic acid-binding Zn-ribbon protein
MNEEINENKYVTEKHLDKRLEEQTQIILSALDSRLDKMQSKLETNLGEKIDRIQTQIDGFVKKQSDFEDEHIIIKEEVRQMKSAFKDKLGVEIRAI